MAVVASKSMVSWRNAFFLVFSPRMAERTLSVRRGSRELALTMEGMTM